jgi:uncharacterized membrane protein YoaK (UPF0700 family)
MIERENTIRNFSLLLAITGGFCDALTFVTSDEFSAHVTGNFIVFAYNVIKGADAQSWLKLVTLPVFMAAVITGGEIMGKAAGKYRIIAIEGLILVLTGLIALYLKLQDISLLWINYLIIMPVVFAMGLQNAFGKLYSKEIYGPTTMMTGNVTQLALDFWRILRIKIADTLIIENIKRQAIIIGGFLVGCLLGAVAGKMIGLSALLLPGIALVIYPKKNIEQEQPS